VELLELGVGRVVEGVDGSARRRASSTAPTTPMMSSTEVISNGYR